MEQAKTIFEKNKPGRRCFDVPEARGPKPEDMIPAKLLRSAPPAIPQVSEPEVVRHYSRLGRRNLGVDSTFYPLGSCTMKYNPKVNEAAAAMDGFLNLHPYIPQDCAQGALELIYDLEHFLAEISGFEAVTLEPAAGAHGEFTGLLVIKAFLDAAGEERDVVLIPDSAHGTNPASCTIAGFDTRPVKSDSKGLVDLEDLKAKLDPKVAALMLTNPNTLGLFDTNVCRIAGMMHDNGSLMYMDGANLNAILGYARPGDFGVDVMHFNLHKTFSTPHGGGGPGSGPVGVKAKLAPFLPMPRVVKEGKAFKAVFKAEKSIGRVRSWFGNTGVMLKAYTYILRLGARGLKRVAENAVLNANYIMESLKNDYSLPYESRCMHECVLSAKNLLKKHDIRAMDVAKRLIDLGFHPPTVYFPLIVEEALMIEPTETENLETLDEFIAAMKQIAKEAEETPGLLHDAPVTTPVGRLDEVKAVKEPRLVFAKSSP